jgi:hypothetical protein
VKQSKAGLRKRIRATVALISPTKPSPVPPCGRCGFVDWVIAEECKQCGARITKGEAPTVANKEVRIRNRNSSIRYCVIGGTIGLNVGLLLGLPIYIDSIFEKSKGNTFLNSPSFYGKLASMVGAAFGLIIGMVAGGIMSDRATSKKD